MSAFGRGTVRTVLLSGLSAVAIACAASFAFADPLPSISSPEAPPSFGDLADVSPLVAVFTAARGARDPAPDVVLSAEPKFGLASGTDSAPREGALARFAAAPEQGPAAPDNLQPVVYDPNRRRSALADAKRAPSGNGTPRRA